MRITFLGTNGWFYKLDEHITDRKKPISLFISHFHLDHVSGLHTLAKFNFSQGLDVFVVPFPVTVVEQFHAHQDHGYRLTLDGKTIVYSGDCGISEASMKLAKSVDLLIHECAYDKPYVESRWGHTDPETAARLAKEANVAQLVLTHFDASIYTTFERRKEAETKARAIFQNTIAATDGLVVDL